MRYVTFYILFIFFVRPIIAQNNLQTLLNNVSEKSLKANLYFLAGDKCEGRMTASKGDSVATNFVEKWMQKYKLKPAHISSYRQSVTFQENSNNIDELIIGSKPYPKYDYWDYQWPLFAFKKGVDIKDAPLVFINYGIATKKYNDFDNVDVKNKVVVHLTGVNTFIKDSLVTEEELSGNFKDYENKGALAAILIPTNFVYEDISGQQKRAAAFKFFQLKGDSTFYGARDTNPFPYLYASKALIREILGTKTDLIDSLKNNVQYLKNDPQALELNNTISIQIKRSLSDNIKSDNLVGMIEGTDKNAGYIVFTAHRDHEGRAFDSTWYGADDNASGTVAMMECMKAISTMVKKGNKPKRSILFISTTAEEHGLLGARYFAENPVVPLNEVKFALNIDMLGRIDSKHSFQKNSDRNYVYPLYYDSLYNFKPVIDEIGKQTGITTDDYYLKNPMEESMIQRSDHIVFGEKGIPFIWFFTGIHKDYHQPTDTPDKINYTLLAKRTKYALGILWKLANQ